MTREIETWLWDSIGSVTIEWLTTEADDQTSLQCVTRQVSSLTILGVEMQVVEVDNKKIIIIIIIAMTMFMVLSS